MTPRIPVTPRTRPKRQLTKRCADGDHAGCHGTVYLYPLPADGDRFTTCQCSVCNHQIAGTFKGK